MIHRTAALLALTVLLAACGDDTALTADERDALDVLVDADLDAAEQRCLLDGLAAAGVSPAMIVAGELTAEEDTEVLATTLECVDDLGEIPSFVDAFIEGAASDGVELTREQAACAISAADDRDPAQAIVACLGTVAPTGSGTHGDDPILDLFWDRCADGNNQACDELYLESPLGSGYEEYARSCAGRLPDSVGGRCFEDLG